MVRRKFALPIQRARRDPRVALSPMALEQRQRAQLWLVMCALALTLWLLLSVRWPAAPGLHLGASSPTDILAHTSVVYNSQLRTEEERARAERNPDNIVIDRDADIPIEQRQQLDMLLQTITEIRQDPSLDRDAEFDRLTNLPNSTIVISESLAVQIVRLDDAQWDGVRQYALRLYDRALSEYGYALNDEELTTLRERSLPYWSRLEVPEEQQTLALFFSTSFLKTNEVLNEEATAQRKQAAIEQVTPVPVRIQEGESIVRRGDPITPEVQEKLEALGQLTTRPDWSDIGGRGLFVALIVMVLGIYIRISQREIWTHGRQLLVVASMFAATVLAARVMLDMPLGSAWPYSFPLAAVAILLAALFNPSLSIVATALLSTLVMFVGNRDFGLGVALFLSSVIGVFVVGRADRSLKFLLAGMTVAIIIALMQTTLWLMTFGENSPGQLIPIAIVSALNGLLSAIVALGLYNLAGHLAGIVTPFQLMELAHPAQPLLRKLIREAPGTYYHSVAVGNLAESAAEAIGADALLLRVAAYYHDIGKSVRPYFFADNQSDRENVHNDLDPQTSAEIIAEHVREGVTMAREVGLPRQIVDFIPTHHGTTVIKHFYQIALQREDTVNVEHFRYPGPKPQTREQAILMLADSVEATVRAKSQNGKLIGARSGHANGNGNGHNTMQTLDELVNSIVDDRVRSGQLDESPLTLHDIARIKQAFITTLQGIYHPRVDYAPQVVKS